MTPAMPLIFALDFQLDRILAEGLDARFARHTAMSKKVQDWCMMDPEDLRVSSTILKNAIENDAPYDFEFRINLPNQKIRYIKSYGKVIRDAQGKPLRLIGINTDITDSKRSQVAAQIMTETEWQIVHSTSEEKIYTILGNGLQKILVSGYVAVVTLNEKSQSFQIQGSYGMILARWASPTAF